MAYTPLSWGTAGGYVTTGDPWQFWTTNTTTATNTNTVVWSSWNSTGAYPITITGGGNVTFSGNTYVQQCEPETPAERETRETAAREREAARVAAETAARETAEETLRLLLDDEQWAAWTAQRQFTVTAPSGRRYLVKRGYAGNIRLLHDTDDTEVESLCCHPDMYDDETYRRVPTEDAVIAQVLALRHNEDHFRETANVTRLRAA